MSERNKATETEKVVERVMRKVNSFDNIGKNEFEDILSDIMQEVENNTNYKPEDILSKAPKVIEDMPKEYGQLSESERSWEAMIDWIYNKYLRELG